LDTAFISLAIGRRLAVRRRELKLSLLQVARRCGVSLQQVHKYETGQSVISAPMLWRLSRCLDVPIGYFFAELEDAEIVG
jgi:transcriptional regulator with XRE-family HTH domain